MREQKLNCESDLRKASKEGNAKEVRNLLTIGIDPYCREWEFRLTPLHLAVENNHFHVVRTLLDSGVNPNVSDELMRAPLHLAAMRNGTYIVQLLLDFGANPNAPCMNDQTALSMAAANGCESVAKLLLEEGANVDQANNVALHMGAKYGRVEIVNILLSAGANPNAAARYGTPLDIALRQGARLYYSGSPENYRSVIQLLIDAGAKSTKTKDELKKLIKNDRELEKILNGITIRKIYF